MNKYSYFKYRKINKRFFDSLKNGIIYFAKRKDLNDPFDCNIYIERSIQNAIESLNDESKQYLSSLIKEQNLFSSIRNDIDSFGICSFSLDLGETLMWSHYANDHRGACILYEFEKEFILEEKNKIIGVSTTNYLPDSLTKWFETIAPFAPLKLDPFVSELAKQLVISKAPAWSYEKEARIIRKDPGAMKIPKEFIKQICFGLQTNDDDINKVKEIVAEYPNKVSMCQIVRGNADFGIDIKEI